LTHEQYMKIAIEEAERGCGWVNPNPVVGAVIVRQGEIIGRGHHQSCGGPHAERNALAACSENPAGATLYVTLEPCCHHGRTPPCTDAIIESGIGTVVIGAKDPNALVCGKGIRDLQRQGVRVVCGVLEEECKRQNEVFFHYITHGTPFTVMKYAMTIDGKIATATGKSRWITGDAARKHVHFCRHKYAGIMVGIGSVLADDPLLTCRMPGGRNPVRIVCDTNLRIPLDAQIVKTAGLSDVIFATAAAEGEKAQLLRERGVQVIPVSKKSGHLDLNELMKILGGKQIDSVFLEGGAALHAAALESGIVNKVQAYIAPKIFGGENAKSAVGGIGMDEPDEAYRLSDRRLTLLGEDMLLEYTLKGDQDHVYRDR
jgi:diaminohydroxyphosphoribosylaminopyrimidine deaminase/5-amino-6-(5-phosphoribosylamino)uracil reductase